MYSVKKAESYQDSMFDKVMLTQNDKGVWIEVGDKPRVSIAADTGRIVVTSKKWWDNKTGGPTIRNMWFDPSKDKLESFKVIDSEAKISSIVVFIRRDEESMRDFMEQVKAGKTEAEYNEVKVKKTSWGWVFEEPGKRRVQIGIDKENNEIWVIDSVIQNKESGCQSVERVDTKIFNLNCELLSFDSATNHGATKRINVKKEEEEITRFLSNPSVKLREKAELQKRDFLK
jgi:hypothetical protein